MLVHSRNQLIDTIIKNIEVSSENGTPQKNKNKPDCNILLKRTNKRLFSNYSSLGHCPSPSRPPPLHHVYKLFNTFGINQVALTTPDFEESFLRTYFYHRVVTRVEKYRNAVVISVVPSTENLSQPATGYIIEKLKSHGREDLFRLASIIQEICGLVEELKNQKMSAIIKEDKESVTKQLNALGDSMFLCKFGLFKIALSNSLLEYLGYNVDEFCIETVKYRTILCDFMSSNIYHRLVTHALTTLKVLMQADLGRATLADYLASSRLQLTDYIYSLHNIRTYCDMEFSIPTRGVICILVKKLHY